MAIWKAINRSEKTLKKMLKVIRIVSENCKNALLDKISEYDKTNFKCNFENDLKFLRKKTCIKDCCGVNKY